MINSVNEGRKWEEIKWKFTHILSMIYNSFKTAFFKTRDVRTTIFFFPAPVARRSDVLSYNSLNVLYFGVSLRLFGVLFR